MHQTIRTGIKLLFSVLLTLALIEVGLRLFPMVIPLELLVNFEQTPRAQIARRLGLPTKWDTVTLPRDDNGPELRIFKPYSRINTRIKDTHTTNSVVLDEQGFCNPPENSYRRPAIDIITLGDSFTFCHAVQPEQTWSAYLGQHTPYSVYNLGKIAIGIHEYLQIFKHFGLQKSPKFVVLNVYEGNDLRDAANNYYYQTDPAHQTPVLPPAVTPLQTVKNTLFEHSYSANLAAAWITTLQKSSANDQTDRRSPEKKHSARNDINFQYSLVFNDQPPIPFNPENTDLDEVQYAQRLYNEELDPGIFWSIDQAFKEFAKLAEQHHFTPIITYTPSAHTAYADNVLFEDPNLTNLMPWFSREQRAFLQKEAAKYGFVFVDHTPALQTAARAGGPDSLLYYRYDLHLTPAGHAVVGQNISRAITELAATQQK
ncbi:MAG: hypothetical protein D6768_12560 [Chloroflexi bacterium]|nr:MAG: hypothetical protein D6768_12560 [Chloroflexota bacterium]